MSELINYGMIGGGEGSFIGDVHRRAIALDGKAVLTAGSFSRNTENNRKTGESLNLPSERIYNSFKEMAREEKNRRDGIDFAVIVTPNASHYEIARTFLEKGISVVCDKPLTLDSAQALELADLAEKQNLLFAVTYTYTGYPVIKHARSLIAKGEIGDIRFINAEYPQEWLATEIEQEGQKQAAWRTDPSSSGISNCVGDIGSHVENMISYITGLEIDRLSARLDIFGKNRKLDDNATIMVDYKSGARGLYWCSQIAVGHDNDLSFRIYGTKGSLSWHQENPEHLQLTYLDKPGMTISKGRDELSESGARMIRLPSGHPEGVFEAFANIYSNYVSALKTKLAGKEPQPDYMDFPSAMDGYKGVRFVEACVESSRKDAAWVKL